MEETSQTQSATEESSSNVFEVTNDESEESSDESEEAEPKLKYERITNDLQSILRKDAISCIAVHTKFLCLGTHWGAVHLLDHLGNGIRSHALPPHTVTVNQLSIDAHGDFVASCSDDGKVLITGLYTDENSHNLNLDRLVKSIAIDPNYYKSGSGRKFITGDERLVLHEKVFFNRHRSTVLAEAEGSVKNVCWSGQFVAWASDLGVRIYDMYNQCSLGLIKWTRYPDALPEKFNCNMCWKNSSTLLIGWADTVRVCAIKKRDAAELAANKDLPQFMVEQAYTFRTEFYVSGVAPLGNLLVVLGVPREKTEDGKSQRPQLRVVEPRNDEYVEICTDSFSIRGFQEYVSNDYQLECLIEDCLFFVVSPKDMVVARPCDADDHVQWLVEHKKFESALEAVSEAGPNELKNHNFLQVGRSYLDHLLATQQYDQAGQLCLKILGKDKRLWEEEVYKFVQVQRLRSVSPFLPRGEDRLNPHIYEMVLYEFLKMEPEGFLRLVNEWSPSLYNVPAVVNAVLEHLLVSDEDKETLLRALAILYSHEKKYDKALAMYLKLGHPDVFNLIRKHNLLPAVTDMIEGLMELDSDQTIKLLLDHTDKVSPDTVVARLQSNRKMLYVYLDALYWKESKDSSRKYHGTLVQLYADYNKDKLLPFLRSSDQYPIQEALEICQQRSLIPETVFLLARMGNTKEALRLITEEIRNVKQAISFCKEYDDEELWEQLILFSLDKPDFINELLQNIGTHVDPRILIQRINIGQKIPGLRDSLVKIMHDYSLQVSLQEGCNKILMSDYFNLHERLVRTQQRGVLVDAEQVCGACHHKIISSDLSQLRNITVFYCKHVYHEDCLPVGDMDMCLICPRNK